MPTFKGPRFASGESTATTRKISNQTGHGFSRGHNGTMHGLPGFIKSGQDTSASGLKGGSGSGPKREGPIGKKGSSGVLGKGTLHATGSTDKSYKATSTGPAGRVSHGKMESLRGRAKTSWEK